METTAALITRSDTLIPPFDEPAREILVANERLGTYQDRILSELGIAPTRIPESEVASRLGPGAPAGETLLFAENLFFSPEFLTEFMRRSRASGAGLTRACLKRGVFSQQLAVLQEVEQTEEHLAFPLFFAKGTAFDPKTAVSIVIDVDEHFESGNFPRHMLGKDNFRFSVTTRPILALTEPVHIGLASMAANFARLGRLRKPGPVGALRALLAILTAFSLDRETLKARALRALSRIDPTARVHPTAVVEGSVIGPGARIGAYAVVRFSVVGADAFVDDHAGIKFSIIGDRAYIANNNVIFFSTVYPGAFLISGPYHFCCFGYDSAIFNSIPSDYRLDGKTIKVATSRGVQDTGLRFGGSIVGHKTRIAAGLIFPPGRAIPGGVTLYPDPARVVGNIDPDLPRRGQVWYLKDGRLVDTP
ncbi:MAG: hypothetical protein HY815_01615 [Candidatus Riflebacteria bacterium]|nr:hypothetical protein [Candidatus Riflebacteria bacterium]